MTVDPEGAELVRLIFHKYGVERKGTSIIARELWNIVQAELERRNRRGEHTNGESTEKLEYEIRQLTRKKESILDAFFSKDITKEEMRLMNERYDHQMAELQRALHAAREREQLSYEVSALKADVKAHIGELLAGEVDESFFKSVLDTMIVYPERRIELRLQLLPQKWRFVLDSIADIRRRSGVGCHFNPDVPTNGFKWNHERKLPELQGIPAPFWAENTNVRVPGYLFSMNMEQEGTRRKVKPVWQIDICVALPDDRTFRKGGAVR